MRGPTPINPYEVYCTHCSVSFPVGTRVCLHCGQPIGRSAASAAALQRSAAPDEDALEDFPMRSPKFSPLTLAWLVAGVATVAYRACT
jgi:hypothetical protein